MPKKSKIGFQKGGPIFIEASFLLKPLPELEQDQFESFFLCSPGRHERLRFAKALRAYGLKSEAKAVAPGRSPVFLTLNSFFQIVCRHGGRRNVADRGGDRCLACVPG